MEITEKLIIILWINYWEGVIRDDANETDGLALNLIVNKIVYSNCKKINFILTNEVE